MMLYNDKFWKDNFYDVKIGTKSFGSLYIKLVLELLEEIYKPMGKWGKLYGERNGVFNTGYSLENVKMFESLEEKYYQYFHKMTDTEWSFFNKADTHTTGLTTNMNYIIKRHNVDLDFSIGNDNESLKKNRLSWNKFKDLMIEEKMNIFTPNGENSKDIFNDLLSNLAWTYYVGERSELISMKNFKNILGYKKIVKSKMGQFKDTLHGKDFEADDDSVQAKSFGKIEKRETYIRFPDVSTKKYDKVNLFSFWCDERKSWFVFKNENVRMGKRTGFTFPLDSLIYPSKTDYLSELEKSL